ncbi:ATP-binding protein [Mesomycoplasma ovipneumoniae]|uniref:ATP-binding protein n=1 Tax=Mesomycoplasma ovipneumoniae TaxID=29562 RepID=A0AAW6Q5T3_9BACT|nr:ATP-binding protein [Mesomycoplasma ovipneumoniae]MDF9628054.1 ATP-binding protein [Mesomycoplasma ovipneumoniae]MDO4157927.1 ATP-binding protein [Mesomycoplasma ovipneumoniae]MDO4158291.1 ATP-binding protein [Mesomycoplasma ovipneumoniae]MDO6821646.1 ATP-binding protein [Mesomycoplasma ovipneumoniae]MDO6855546.1 ATP-binding protein [Mesomycoplasma ovipneumoniae]
MIIKRDFYLNQIIDKKENGRIKIITGIRRCGKSYLLFNFYRDYLLSNGTKENQIITIALDEIDNIEYRNPFRLNEYIKQKTKNINKMYYIFIDEIQLSENVSNPYVETNEKNITFVDVLLSLMKHSNLDIYITGSNSKMLSSDLLTQFRDRGDQVHVNPLSFAEVYELFDDKSEALEHYFVYGGMPHIYKLQNDEQKSHYLKQLFKQTYIKDILERNQIYNEQQILEILLDFTSSNIGSLTNPSKLANRFLSEKQIHISSNTIFKYLKFFEESYIIQRAYRYDVKGSKYFSTPLKYYFSDIGLRNARLNFRQIENTHIMENIIYNDLLRRGYNIDIGVVEYEFKNGSTRRKIQLEIDFVINKGHKRYYIQSAFNIDNLEKKEQEITSLKKIDDSFKKIVIVRNKIIPKHDENGILYIGLEDFLLNESIIDL